MSLEVLQAVLFSHFSEFEPRYTVGFASIGAMQIVNGLICTLELGSEHTRDILDSYATPVLSLVENILSILFLSDSFHPFFLFFVFFAVPIIERHLLVTVAWSRVRLSASDVAIMAVCNLVASGFRDSAPLLLVTMSDESIFGSLWLDLLVTVLLWVSAYISDATAKKIAGVCVCVWVCAPPYTDHEMEDTMFRSMACEVLDLKKGDAAALPTLMQKQIVASFFESVVALIFFVLAVMSVIDSEGYDYRVSIFILIKNFDPVMKIPLEGPWLLLLSSNWKKNGLIGHRRNPTTPTPLRPALSAGGAGLICLYTLMHLSTWP